MSTKFKDLINKRRSIYNLDNQITIPEEQVTAMISECLKQAPTAFNSQSARLVVLYQNAHKRFWTKTLLELKNVAPANKLIALEQKISSFSRAYGTILFFEDEEIISFLQQNYPDYKENFPLWSLESNGMLQYSLWCMFAESDIGASLQHYSPLVENFIYTDYQIPASWKLLAQMPFGRITAPAEEKEYQPLEPRLQIKR